MTFIKRLKNEMMVIKALGVVYGDIGTSPIYTLAIICALITPTVESIFGILSFVFWTLTILVTIQYAWLATSLSRRGGRNSCISSTIIITLFKKCSFYWYCFYSGIFRSFFNGRRWCYYQLLVF